MEFTFGGVLYTAREGESVLQTLLRHRVDIPYSCGIGVCQTCLLRESGVPLAPPVARIGLRDTLREQGFLLACVCPAVDGLDLLLPKGAELYRSAVVCAKDSLAPDIYRLRLLPDEPFGYRPGQFINLRRSDGLVRSYSIASLPGRDSSIELHVQRRQGGDMTRWIAESLAVGDRLEFEGPNGGCFYLPERPLDPLLLIGTGTGLAPLMGIVGDALMQGHLGPIHLYHGSGSNAGLYGRDQLWAMAAHQPRLHLHFCVSRDVPDTQSRSGRAKDIAFAEHPDLTGYRVYLCGAPEMVNSAKKAAYLAGARMQDIHADPFENKDLRAVARS